MAVLGRDQIRETILRYIELPGARFLNALKLTPNTVTLVGFGFTVAAAYLVASGWLHFVASDAHDSLKRPPDLRDAYRAVAEREGIPTAARLFTHNPLAVLCDEPLAAAA